MINKSFIYRFPWLMFANNKAKLQPYLLDLNVD